MLTVLWDPDSLNLIFPNAKQQNEWTKGMGYPGTDQQVIHCLDLLPVWTQEYNYGLKKDAHWNTPGDRLKWPSGFTSAHPSAGREGTEDGVKQDMAEEWWEVAEWLGSTVGDYDGVASSGHRRPAVTICQGQSAVLPPTE